MFDFEIWLFGTRCSIIAVAFLGEQLHIHCRPMCCHSSVIVSFPLESQVLFCGQALWLIAGVDNMPPLVCVPCSTTFQAMMGSACMVGVLSLHGRFRVCEASPTKLAECVHSSTASQGKAQLEYDEGRKIHRCQQQQHKLPLQKQSAHNTSCRYKSEAHTTQAAVTKTKRIKHKLP